MNHDTIYKPDIENYHVDINSISYQQALNNANWQFTKELILDYLNSAIPDIEKIENKRLATYVRYYNRISSSNKAGLNRVLLDMPKYLFCRIYDNAII